MATEINPIYRFTLTDRTSSVSRVTQPVWKNDLALEYQREQGQQFFRTKLSGKLVFVGEDGEWIINRGYSHEIGVLLERSNDMGSSWSTAWTGHFFMTDCEVNLDDSKVTVQPEVDDQYNKILAGMEKEYNLVDLLPQINYVHMKKFPLIQIYYPGETTLSCIYNGMSWEQDVDAETSDEVLTEEYHFSRNSDKREISLKQNGSVYGIYEADTPQDPRTSYDVYFLPISGGTGTRLHVVYTVTVDQTYGYMWSIVIQLLDSSDNALYEYRDAGMGTKDTSDMEFVMSDGQGGTMDGQAFTRAIYSRILLDVYTFDGNETAPLSSSDFCHDNRNYTRAIGFVLGARYLMTSAQTQVNPTEWGKASNGQYFIEPTASDDLFPIARTTWDNTSVWFVNDGNIIDYIRSYGQKTKTLRTAYPLSSVISVLLGQIDSSITHAASTSYSEFLYAATNPVSGQTNRTLLITPKSNILAGEFSQPAMKAPVTLKNIFDMLRDVFQCYWHVDNGKLCIEHIEYYKNGGTYGAYTIGWDTKAMKSRNGKPWAFATSVYKYDKEQMPERFQYGWMDDVTEPFMGQPVDVLSPYVEEGQIEETRVSLFTSDIDYMMLNPQAMSKDGFALMAGTPDNGEYRLSEGQIYPGFGGWTWIKTNTYLQNWELAYCFLQPYYWRYDMPSRNIVMNGMSIQVLGVRRTKRQEIRFPVYNDPNPTLLVDTYLGHGFIEKMTLVLSSRIAKTVLKYEPE